MGFTCQVGHNINMLLKTCAVHRWIQELKLGGRGKVERQRRKPSRNTEGAKKGGVWGGG